MWLHRVTVNPRNKGARRDLADPYQMHATLCRAFFPPDAPCPSGALLWRLEPEADMEGRPRVLIQANATPTWSALHESDWLASIEPGINLVQKLGLGSLATGQTFRFRLRANPTKTTKGKRVGLIGFDAQLDWLKRKSEQHGFLLPEPDSADFFEFVESTLGQRYPDVRVSQEQMLTGRKHDGVTIRVFSVQYDGRLIVRDPYRFRAALESGIGHGKVLGQGMLSVIPLRR